MTEPSAATIKVSGGKVVVEGHLSSEERKLLAEFFGKGESVNCGRPIKSHRRRPTKSDVVFGGELCAEVAWYWTDDLTVGPGPRTVIQLQGCSIRCPGCYLQELWIPGTGVRVRPVDLVNEVLEADGRLSEYAQVTIMGGEPFDQSVALRIIVFLLKQRGVHVVVYTGHTIEYLASYAAYRHILSSIDILIEGPFIAEQAENAGEWRGSRNQRVIENPSQWVRDHKL